MAGWTSSAPLSPPWLGIEVCSWCFPWGDQVDPDLIGRVPDNAIIVERAPQLELLKRTSVCVTHAGLNTVLESLAQGVPQVAIPGTPDQPGVAARIAHHQTGAVTSLDKLTADHLSTL